VIEGRRARTAVLGLAVVAACAVGLWLALRPSVHRGGPLGETGWSGTSVPIVAGDVVAAGDYQFINYGRTSAVLESARPLGLPPDLEVVRTYALGKHRPKQAGGGMYPWPDDSTYPRKLLRHVKGFRATPERADEKIAGTNIVFLVRAKRPGNYRFDFVELTYRVGNKRYRRIMTITWAACARPPGTPEKDCDIEMTPSTNKQLDDWYDRTSGDW
jgi:hypothetical protein